MRNFNVRKAEQIIKPNNNFYKPLISNYFITTDAIRLQFPYKHLKREIYVCVIGMTKFQNYIKTMCSMYKRKAVAQVNTNNIAY